MLTAFGKKLRSIRLERDMLLKRMAELLDVTPAFLSAVETGKKSVPPKWVDIIADELRLNSQQREELRQLAEEATSIVRIDMRNSGQIQRNAALMFARSFNALTDEEAKSIINFLHEEN